MYCCGFPCMKANYEMWSSARLLSGFETWHQRCVAERALQNKHVQLSPRREDDLVTSKLVGMVLVLRERCALAGIAG